MAASRFFHRPIYLQVRDALARRIASGEWKPGQAIPNEVDLGRDLGVSTGTIRKALELMEDGRMLTRRQGRGTFVTDPAADGLVNSYCGIRTAGGETLAGDIAVTDVAQDAATKPEAMRLQLNKGDRVWRLVRVRRQGERAFMRELVVLPVSFFPEVRADSANRIVDVAHRRGLVLGPAEERIALGAASADNAEALGVALGTPLILLDRLVRTAEGQPVEWRVAECHIGAGHYLARVGRGSGAQATSAVRLPGVKRAMG